MRLFILTLLFFTVLPLYAQKPAEVEGKNYALFFYVDKYMPGWPQLPEAGNEVNAIKTELEKNYDYTCEVVQNPTKEIILSKCEQFGTKLREKDRLFVFFSMQGTYDQTQKIGYIIPADALKKDTEHKTWLSFLELYTIIGAQSGHALVTFDACLASDNFIPSSILPSFYPTDCHDRINSAFKSKVRQWLSTTDMDPKSSGKSTFAESFLEILQNDNTDGIISSGEIYKKLPESAMGSLSGNEYKGDFLFVRKNACPPRQDRDGDSVPDDQDACPDTWGNDQYGCPQSVGIEREQQDLIAWKKAKERNNEAAYIEYQNQFPDGKFRLEADHAIQQLLEQKRDELSWNWAVNKNTQESYRQYLLEHPDGLYRQAAEEKLQGSNFVPNFPWPPPECALRRRLASDLTAFKHLGQISKKLCDTLEVHGYTQRGFYRVPNGFALVTQMEQFKEDGSPMTSTSRWVEYPVREISDLWSYFKALVLPSYGYFRIFVFVVTDAPYANSGRKVSREVAARWVDHGANELPGDVLRIVPNKNHRLDLLIYEFETPITTKICTQKCPCRLTYKMHLMRSNLNHLGFDRF